ncbi:MAG: PAS domain-containing protein [Saprospiraceae bacterium]|nr:PAS domain-containing protein [Saprospiraceae bacterium]
MPPSIAVIVTDADRRILWVNEDFSEITGYTLMDVVGKKPGKVLQGPDSEKGAIRRIRKGLDAQIPLKEEITNYRKNGEAYCCRLVIHPIFNEDNVLTNFIAFEVDGDETDDSELPLLQLKNKYQSSSLKGKEAARLFSALQQLMEEERLYRDPKLNLRQLSDRLKTNTKYLSQVVNLHGGGNLQSFLNSYRIEEAKQKLIQRQFGNLTLYGIAMQCGFKNKSTFYKVFKQLTGKTPLEFVRHRREQER